MRLLLLAIGLAVLVLLCRTLGLDELRRAVANASPATFVAFLVLSGSVFLVYAMRWSVVLRAMNAPPLPITTLVCFRAAEHAVSTLLPSGHLSGEPLRALLLRRRGLDWTVAISSVAMDRLLDMTASSVIGPVYVAIFFFANDSASWAVPWVMAGMLALAASLASFYYLAIRGEILVSILARRGFLAPLRGAFESIDRNLVQFIRTPSFRVGIALSLVAELLIIAELWTLSRAFHLSLSLPTLVGVMVGMGIAQLLPVPAAVGSLEATEVGVLTLAGAAAPLGLAVGLLVRLRETLWIVVGLAGLYVEGLTWRAVESPTMS